MMWMMLWMIAFWALAIGGAVWLALSWRRRPHTGDPPEVLRQRLARGEIDVEEFARLEAALRRTERRPSRGRLLAVVVAVAMLVAVPTIIMAANGWDMDMSGMHGSGKDTTGDPAVRGGDAADVRIVDFAFKPGNLEVPAGAVVTWTNEDSAPHDATARSGDWKTGRLSKGERATVTFESAGSYAYYCSIHPSMKAQIIVR